VADIQGVTTDERIALLLAASMLETGLPAEPPDRPEEDEALEVARALARSLLRVSEDPDRSRQIITSLRAAASESLETAAP
jgi:hypothetical protein